MEHYYENIQGWFDFQYIYKDMIEKSNNKAIFVEIGSWLGKSSSYMGVEIKKSGKEIKFDCIDLWEFTNDDSFYKEYFLEIGDIYSVFLENIKNSGVSDVVNPIKLDSISASSKYEDNSIDFIFIDANHNYDFIKKDIQVWYPKVKSGGYIGGHDYGRGVKVAVDEFFKDDKELLGTSWLHYKK